MPLSISNTLPLTSKNICESDNEKDRSRQELFPKSIARAMFKQVHQANFALSRQANFGLPGALASHQKCVNEILARNLPQNLPIELRFEVAELCSASKIAFSELYAERRYDETGKLGQQDELAAHRQQSSSMFEAAVERLELPLPQDKYFDSWDSYAEKLCLYCKPYCQQLFNDTGSLSCISNYFEFRHAQCVVWAKELGIHDKPDDLSWRCYLNELRGSVRPDSKDWLTLHTLMGTFSDDLLTFVYNIKDEEEKDRKTMRALLQVRSQGIFSHKLRREATRHDSRWQVGTDQTLFFPAGFMVLKRTNTNDFEIVGSGSLDRKQRLMKFVYDLVGPLSLALFLTGLRIVFAKDEQNRP